MDCQNGKRWFFFVLFGFWWFCFFGFSVFLCFCFVHNSPKWLFSCIFRGFLSISFPQKAWLKLFVFFLLFFFCFCLLFNPLFSLLFVHQPLFRKDSLWGFFYILFWLAFSFPNVCLFIWNKFCSHPFLKPKLLSFLAVYFSSVVQVFVFMVYVSAFLFLCWLCFWYLFVLVLCFCFLSCCLFCFQSMKTERLFSLQFWCFFELCCLKG